jgi:hypothetical protein
LKVLKRLGTGAQNVAKRQEPRSAGGLFNEFSEVCNI